MSTPALLDKVLRVIAICMSSYHILYISNAFDFMGFYIDPLQHMCYSLSFLIIVVFLAHPKIKVIPRNKLWWNHVVFLLMGVPFPLYLAFEFTEKQVTLGIPTTFDLVLGTMLIITLIEAARRTIGWIFATLIMGFIFYPFIAHFMPGVFHSSHFSFDRVVGVLTQEPSALFGISLHVAATIVIAFVIFAAFLEVSGTGEFFINMAYLLCGRVKGGPAKAAVIASALFGTVSGNAAANVVATGTFTIPLMKRAGYMPYFAGAVEGVASTGGQIMPPVMGAAAFLMAEWLEIPYVQVCIAAFIPAVLYFFNIFLMVDLEAKKIGLKGARSEEMPPMRQAIIKGWHHIAPLAVFVFFLVVLQWRPEVSALYATAAIVVCSIFKKETRLGPKKILRALEKGAYGMAIVGIACATVGFIIGIFSLTGLGFRFSTELINIAGNSLIILLLLTAIASLVLGMGLPTIACYLILAILVAPALAKLGVPTLAAHLFVFYFGLASFITPPVCVPTYIAATIAGASPLKTAFQAMRLGIIAYIVPFLFVYEPAILMMGKPITIIMCLISYFTGVLNVAAGLTGYLLKKTNWLQRILLLVGGTVSFIPHWVIGTITGMVILALVGFWQWMQLKNFQKETFAINSDNIS